MPVPSLSGMLTVCVDAGQRAVLVFEQQNRFKAVVHLQSLAHQDFHSDHSMHSGQQSMYSILPG